MSKTFGFSFASLISALFATCILIACGQKAKSSTDNASTTSDLISIEDAKTLVDKGEYIFIDVRTPQEVDEGAVRGSLHFNLYHDNFESRLNKLDREAKYVVYCRRGGRSAEAYSKMKEMGFTHVKDMTDGYDQWK